MLGGMKNVPFAAGVLLAALLAGCSGGGSSPTPTSPSGGSTTPTPTAAPTATPVGATPTPTAAPTATPQSVLATANFGGTTAFETPTDFAVYEFDGDTVANQSTCTGGCLAAWPPVPVPANAPVPLPSPWSKFTRSDDAVVQLTYNGKPLYTFASDTQAGVATGNGVAGFSLATPAAAATATPGPTPTPYQTPYAKARHPG
jgi:predicted lipoprotein with Yx(FWY)xxD motif